jgi:hypothetical protein
MAVDTVTLELSGDVALDDFSLAISRLRNLLTALEKDVAAGADILWLVDALETGSALTVYKGSTRNGGGPTEVEKVVRAYGEVGQVLERNGVLTYSPLVEREARGLLKVLQDGRIEAIRFETPEVDAIVSGLPEERKRPTTTEAYGAIEGRVQTLSSRGGLRFTLYDTLNDRAVSCYLAEDFDQEQMRDVWGRRAIIEGWVKRDATRGRPLTIRRVSNVVVRPETEPGTYREARAAVPLSDSTLLPELVIRRLRDA